MSKNVTIKLEEPIEDHHGLVHNLVVRPPLWQDVMGIGSPYTIHRDKEDKPFLVYDEAAIAHYADVLVVEPSPMLLAKVGLRDTIAAREAIIGFFLDAAAARGGSATSPKTSSSD